MIEAPRLSLRKERLRRGVTIPEIANFAKISASHYRKIEQGTRNPSMEVAKLIADCLGKSMECIFFCS